MLDGHQLKICWDDSFRKARRYLLDGRQLKIYRQDGFFIDKKSKENTLLLLASLPTDVSFPMVSIQSFSPKNFGREVLATNVLCKAQWLTICPWNFELINDSDINDYKNWLLRPISGGNSLRILFIVSPCHAYYRFWALVDLIEQVSPFIFVNNKCFAIQRNFLKCVSYINFGPFFKKI